MVQNQAFRFREGFVRALVWGALVAGLVGCSATPAATPTSTSGAGAASATGTTGTTGTTGSSSGSTGSSSSSSSGSTGISVPATFDDFCVQAGASACAQASRCGLLDPTVVANCNELLSFQMFGCGGLSSRELDAGHFVFDSIQAQSCLEALATEGCTAADAFAVTNVCGSVLAPNTPVGASCTSDTQCLFPDAGLWNSIIQGGAPGCRQDCSDRVCSIGGATGDPCGWMTGNGCVEGTCAWRKAIPDSGPGFFCLPLTRVDGGFCEPGIQDCDPSSLYCNVPPDAGAGTCAPLVGDGGPCEVELCPGSSCTGPRCHFSMGQPECPCSLDERCHGNASAGRCLPAFTVGAPCDPGLESICANGTICWPVTSYSSGLWTCAGPAYLGDPCGAAIGVACALPFRCSDPDGGTCVAAGNAGDVCSASAECNPGLQCIQLDAGASSTCEPLARAGSECGLGVRGPWNDIACGALLGCVDEVCEPEVVNGGQCTPDFAAPFSPECGEGYCAPVNASGVCQPRVGVGAPCESVSQNGNVYDTSCDINLFCEYFDGGSTCHTGACP